MSVAQRVPSLEILVTIRQQSFRQSEASWMGKVDTDNVDGNINTLHFALFLNSFTIKYDGLLLLERSFR